MSHDMYPHGEPQSRFECVPCLFLGSLSGSGGLEGGGADTHPATARTTLPIPLWRDHPTFYEGAAICSGLGVSISQENTCAYAPAVYPFVLMPRVDGFACSPFV